MNRLAEIIEEHTWQAWTLALLISLAAGLLVGTLSRSGSINERIAQLKIQAERRSVELALLLSARTGLSSLHGGWASR